MVYWNCETELFFCWVWTCGDLKAISLNFLFFWVTSKLIASCYALNFTNARSWVMTLKLSWQVPFCAILRLNCAVQLISLWPVSCCLLALIGVSFCNKSRIIFFSQLLMWLVIIGVIIKVIPLVISMWVILRQTHFSTLIWCEIVGFVATFPLSLFLLLFSSAYPT